MDAYIRRWNFIRGETLEILEALDDEKLLFKPEGERWRPLFYQFGCIARTQLIYAEAAKTGKMDFALFGSNKFPEKYENKTVADIKELLNQADTAWLAALAQNEGGVAWPADQRGKLPLLLHIQALAEHERLHHGQLISYFTLAGFNLPPEFKNNWAL